MTAKQVNFYDEIVHMRLAAVELRRVDVGGWDEPENDVVPLSLADTVPVEPLEAPPRTVRLPCGPYKSTLRCVVR